MKQFLFIVAMAAVFVCFGGKKTVTQDDAPPIKERYVRHLPGEQGKASAKCHIHYGCPARPWEIVCCDWHWWMIFTD